MVNRELKIFLEGHDGHRGNALAHALTKKLSYLLSALGQFERRFSGNSKRRTEYEIVDTKKWNPTELVLHPVPKVRRYDPVPAFDWTIEQLERVARGETTDDRVDAALADTLASLAEKHHEFDYSRFWISAGGQEIVLGANFRANALKLSDSKKMIERAVPLWITGVSYGSVVGELRQIGDLDGEQRFVITPPLGSKRIECTFEEKDREVMRACLWRVVRVHGLLHYKETSPFPYAIDMAKIEPMPSGEGRTSLRGLRGIFKGFEKGDLGDIINV